MRDLDRQLEFIVDDKAEPSDQDQALARFLLSLVRTETSPEKTSPVGVIHDQGSKGKSRFAKSGSDQKESRA
ncbi:MAG TPA: hypothetical protein QF564_07285 [Pirellulaceae bacterium]|nr:hypothetical protein [Pirellulaceae bacterium]